MAGNDPFGAAVPLDQFGPEEKLPESSDPLVTGKGMVQNAQRQASQAVRQPLTRATAARDELNAPMPGSFEGHPENVGEYLPATIKPAVAGVRDIGRGDFARGAHELISSAGNATLPVAALTAGGASLPRLLGTALGATAGGKIARSGAQALNLSPDQQDLAGDIGAIAGGYGGSRIPDIDTAPARNFAASKLRYPATERQSLMGRPGTIKPILPSIMQKYVIPDWMIPEGEAGTPTNPGPFREFVGRNVVAPKVGVELGSPENPGFYAKLPTRMPELPAPEKLPPELGSPGNPGFMAKLPTRMPTKSAAGETRSIQVPSGVSPRFSGNEGRAATWTNERVMELARQGDRTAIAQAIRRGMKLPENARYILGDADYPRAIYNPRDVTVFTPEGVPIRTGGKKIAAP